MIEILYRFNPRHPMRRPLPAGAAAARRRLEAGNRRFANLLPPGVESARRVLPLDPRDLGWSRGSDAGPEQKPFAGVLGCADARVPIEMVFQEGSNNLFVARVAGNVAGSDCLGSFAYAIAHFTDSLNLLVVLGHSGCGAVTAAVDAYIKPRNYLTLAADHPLKSIVDAILVSVRSAALSLERVHGRAVTRRRGYRAALIAVSVVLNAAWGAFTLGHLVPPRRRGRVGTVFGVYDLGSRAVRLPLSPAAPFRAGEIGLFPAPAGAAAFRRLGLKICAGAAIRKLLLAR